jgi:hypothetical protein
VACRSSVTKSPSAAGALDRLEGAEALAQRVDLLVDVGIGHLDGVDVHGQRLVGGQLELRADVDLGGEAASRRRRAL